MRPKIKLLIVISIAFIFLSVSAIERQNPQWKGTIEEENGIKVIKNPNEPLYGEITFELEEDFCIGKGVDDHYIFDKAGLPVVDLEGNMLVLDKGYFRIQKYNREGKYLQTIGRKGQGPGEFEHPSNLYLDNHDNIYVQDGRHVDVFNKNGSFNRTFKTSGFENHLGIMNGENIFVQVQDAEIYLIGKEGKERIALINSEGEKIKTIVSFPVENPPPLRGRFALSNPWNPSLVSCFINKEFGVYGYPSEYRLFMVNSSGEIDYIIEKDEQGEKFTSKEKDELLDMQMEYLKQSSLPSDYSRSEVKSVYKFPKFKPFFRFIIKDGKNRIYVKRFQLPTDEDETPVFDVFNLEGYYLHKIKIPLNRTPFDQNSIQNGYVYVREYDFDMGYHYIKRYKIKNWDQIREGL